MMKVQREQLVELYVLFGHANADEWDDEKLVKRISDLIMLGVATKKSVLTEEQFIFAKAVRDAKLRGDGVKIVSSDDKKSSAEAGTGKKKSSKDKSSSSKKEEPPVKKKDKKKDKKEKKSKKKESREGVTKPGVIQYVVELLENASKDKPLTVARAVEKAAKKFPDRQESSLRNTIGSQLSCQLRKNRGMNVVKAESGGYYIGKKKK